MGFDQFDYAKTADLGDPIGSSAGSSAGRHVFRFAAKSGDETKHHRVARPDL